MKKKMNRIFVLILSIIVMPVVFTQPANAQSLTPEISSITTQQKTEIEKIIRDYLIRNPSVIQEVNQVLLARAEEEKKKRQADGLIKFSDQIFINPTSPVGGNPNGELTIIAFFDYNCGFCKQSLPYLQELVRNRTSLRIVYKELPILGEGSYLAAKAALAADRQRKYAEFHNALASFPGEISGETIKMIALKLSLDYAKLIKDTADPKLDAVLLETANLANSLGIEGTPAYIIGGEIIPGAVDAATMERILAEAQSKIDSRNLNESKQGSSNSENKGHR